MRRGRHPGRILAWQMLICVGLLSIWQWGYDLHSRLPWLVPDLLDPYFVSKPSQIFEHFLILSCLKSKLGMFNGWFNGEFARCMARSENNLWIATAVTLKNTFFGFVTGVSSGFAARPMIGPSAFNDTETSSSSGRSSAEGSRAPPMNVRRSARPSGAR